MDAGSARYARVRTRRGSLNLPRDTDPNKETSASSISELCNLSEFLHHADWRDSASYEYTRELVDTDWAWEFLRRNKAYAMDWARAGDSALELLADVSARCLKLRTVEQYMQRWGLIFRR